MEQLIGKLEIVDPNNNQKVLKLFCDREEGTVRYRLSNKNGMGFSISNLQCGWRGPSLPDNTYEYRNNQALLEATVKAVRGGTYSIVSTKLFVE